MINSDDGRGTGMPTVSTSNVNQHRSMSIYPQGTEQWRVQLFENPPGWAKKLPIDEWRHLALESLFKPREAPSPMKGKKAPEFIKIRMKAGHNNSETRARHAAANRRRWRFGDFADKTSAKIKATLNQPHHKQARSILRTKENSSRRWMTDLNRNQKFVKADQIPNLLSLGWKLGR